MIVEGRGVRGDELRLGTEGWRNGTWVADGVASGVARGMTPSGVAGGTSGAESGRNDESEDARRPFAKS